MQTDRQTGRLDAALAWVFPSQTRFARYALLAIVVGWWIALFYVLGLPGYDLVYYYLPALSSDSGFFYPYWVRWFIQPIAWIQFPYNYCILMGASTAAIILALRISKGKALKLLLGFPFIWNIWYAQLETFSAVGLLMLWHGLKKQDSRILNLGFILASFKPHITFPAALLVWLWLPSWKERLKAISGLLLLGLLSLLVFGPHWPIEWINTVRQAPFFESYNNSSLFPFLGFGALVLWIPIFIIPLRKEDRFLAAIATTLLTIPYAPVYSQLALYFWAFPWWLWSFGQLVWLEPFLSDIVYRLCALFPIGLLLRIYLVPYLAKRRPTGIDHSK